MQEYIEVGYALSNRCRCQTCQQAIVKSEIKIGHVYVRKPQARYDRKLWYHVTCLQSIPKGDRNQDLDIVNLHNLSAPDQEKVKQRLAQLKANGYQKRNTKEMKFLTKQEHYNSFIKEPRQQYTTYLNYMKEIQRQELFGEEY